MPAPIACCNQHLPNANWQAILPAALLLLVAFIGFIEYQLARKGFEPTVVDSRELWLQQRQRAADLGAKALILIGSSRIQLGVDLDLLRRQTGLEPVQLAIDGSSFWPVLQGLAQDPAIRGTILVDYMDHLLAEPRQPDRANEYQQQYQQQSRLITSASTERELSQLRSQWLRSYADGARPLTSLITRVLEAKPARQYLVTLPDRSRKADYSLVPMPDFYYQRVLRNLGNPSLALPAQASYSDLDQALQQKIAEQPTTDPGYFQQQTAELAKQVQAIQGHGGKVAFIVMPASGLVRQLEQQRYPRQQFWQYLTQQAQANGYWHFADDAELTGLQCPDGSHLDQRSISSFSQQLVTGLKAQGLFD